MTPLQKRIKKDFGSVQNKANYLFEVFMQDVGDLIDIATEDCLSTVAAVLSITPDLKYVSLQKNNTIERLYNILQKRYENLAADVETSWIEKRKYFDLLSRLGMSFVSRKASPPWVETYLNLKDELPTDGRYSPWKGYILFTFSRMVDHIMKEIERGAINEETFHQIMQRVRSLFSTRKRKGVREGNYFDPEFDSNTDDLEFTMRGPISIDEGAYTLEDVERFYQQLVRANQWEHRGYQSYMTDAMKANNRWLRDLEQMLKNDAIEQLHSGMLQIGSEDMGIDDMEWVVSRPQPVCDECTIRDGLTMREIKSQIKDEYKDDPPPLHPNCRCELVPKINDSWAKKHLTKDEYEWDADEGIVYKANKQEKDLGFGDMTFDDYLKSVRGV